jgi:hypothetical protein
MLVGMAQKRKSTAKKVPVQLRNRALFELGRDSQQLLAGIHDEYPMAGPDDGFPTDWDTLAAQINTSMSTLADGFRGTKTTQPLRDLQEAFDKAWKQLRRDWLGKEHSALVLWARNHTEPWLIPESWFQENSPLKHKAWSQFHATLDRLANKLPRLEKTLLSVGRLMSQVRRLSDSVPLQEPILGEPDAPPALQAGLHELRVLLDLDIDVELQGTLTQPTPHDTVRESLDRIHRDLLMHISRTKSTGRHSKKRSTGRSPSNKTVNGSVQADGPVAPFWFWWDGRRYKVERPLIWKLLNYLWRTTTRSANFEELAEHVWECPVADLTQGTIGSARTAAREFFHRHKIPLIVSVMGRTFILEEA